LFKVFQASSPEVEVDGRTVIIVSSGMLVGSVARELLGQCGLNDVQSSGWFNQQKWLHVYRAIHDHLGADTLYSIGRRVPYAAEFPEERMVDVSTALQSIDAAYQVSHRGGEIGHYRYVEVGLDQYEIHCDNPYSNQFDLGIVTSLVQRFRGRFQYNVRMKQPAEDPFQDNACIIEVVRV
jgi:hypothetical protein